MTELQILSAVKNNGGSIGYVALLNLGLSDPVHDPLTDRDLIRKLIDTQVLFGKPGANSTISFGKEGRLRLQELQQLDEEHRQKVSDNEANKKADRKSQLLNTLLGAVIGAILTLLVELIL